MQQFEGKQQWKECQETGCGKIFESTQDLCPGCDSKNYSPFELSHKILIGAPEILERILTTNITIFALYFQYH